MHSDLPSPRPWEANSGRTSVGRGEEPRSASDGPRPDAVGLASVPLGRWGALLLGILVAAACSLAVKQGWQNRYDVWSDGLSYLDMADAFSRGDWTTAANGTWSPLYPFLVGRVLAALRPSPAMEGPAVQVLNLVILALAAAAFAFLAGELARLNGRPPRGAESWKRGALWGTAWALVAAVVFTQTALEQFVRNDYVSPDLCVAAAFFLATALVVRILRKGATTKTYAALGAALGLGCLAKSIFFPLALLFIVAAFGAGGARSKAARGVGVSLAVLALIAAPWVVFLSRAKGRLTFGDAGRLNYAWYVGGVPVTPLPPARLLESDPDIYELDRPMAITYPGWYDPSYWYEGVRARFDARRQAAVIAMNARWYAHALGGVPARGVPVMQATVVWGLALLLIASGLRRIRGNARRYAWVLVPALGGLGLYLLVHVEARYVGAMVAVLFLVGFALVRFQGVEARRFVTGVVAIILVIWFGRYAYALSQWVQADRRADDRSVAPNGDLWPLEVADGLRGIGVPRGARVAFVGKSAHFYWARLAGVRIVTELRDGSLVEGTPETDYVSRYWLSDPASRLRVLNAFRRAGAGAVVTDARPAEDGLWRPLGRSGLFGRVLESGETR